MKKVLVTILALLLALTSFSLLNPFYLAADDVEAEEADEEVIENEEVVEAEETEETEEAEVSRSMVGDGENVVRIALDGEPFSREAMLEVLQEFYDETGISTELLFIPTTGEWAGFYSKIQTMIAGGNSPDIIRLVVEGFELFRTNGLLEPLNPYIEKYPEWHEMVSDNHEKIEAPYIVDGERYGYGFDWNTVVTFINTDIMEEVGLEMPTADEWTYEKFLEYAEAMTFEREDGSKVVGVNAPDWYFVISAWLFNNNASILNEDFTESVVNSPEAVEVIQNIRDLIYEHEVAPVSPADFISGQVGMMFSGRWSLKGMNESEFFAADVLPVPSMATRQAIAGGGIFPVSSSSEKKDEAFKLACWLSRPESQEKIMDISAVPTSVSAMENVVATNPFPENTMLFVESADVAKYVESPSTYGQVQEIFMRYISLVLADEMAVQEAMDAAKAEIDLALMLG